MIETTLCGTLFIYQGEELGMRNVPRDWPASEYKDIESVNYWKQLVSSCFVLLSSTLLFISFPFLLSFLPLSVPSLLTVPKVPT